VGRSGKKALVERLFEGALDRLSAVFGDATFRLNEPSSSVEHTLRQLSSEMRSLFKRKAEFFSRFDYEWVFQPESYDQSLEVILQYYLLRIASEIDESHPNAKGLGNIVVRILPTKEWAPFCQKVDRWSFILFPSPFTKALQQYALAHIMLYKMGRHLPPVFETVVRSNRVQGEVAERLIRQRPDFACQLAEQMAEPFWSAINRKIPQFGDFTFEAFLSEESEKGNDVHTAKMLCSLPILAEVFVLCHELAHILEHDFQNSERNILEELEADQSGVSLSIIADSELGLPQSVGTTGAAMFFSVAEFLQKLDSLRSVNIGRPLQNSEPNTDKKAAAHQGQIHQQSMEELALRRRMHCVWFAEYGLLPLPKLFFGVFNELSLINAYVPVAVGRSEDFATVFDLLVAQETWWSELDTIDHSFADSAKTTSFLSALGISKINVEEMSNRARKHMESLKPEQNPP
jgi:hypothetical protein